MVSGHGTQLHLVKNDWDMYSSVQSDGPKDSTLPREKELQDVKNKREERELVKMELLAPPTPTARPRRISADQQLTNPAYQLKLISTRTPSIMDKREDVLHRGTVINWYGTGLAVVVLVKSARTGPCSFLVG